MGQGLMHLSSPCTFHGGQEPQSSCHCSQLGSGVSVITKPLKEETCPGQHPALTGAPLATREEGTR